MIKSKTPIENQAPKKAAFLDRDGVICEYMENLIKPHQLVLRPKVASAIRLLNENDFLVLVVTNQPDIAKGKMTLLDLNNIHLKMQDLLSQENAYLDKIYFCPHKVGGIVKEYALDCQCRKPKSGMLTQAISDFNIDIRLSFMVGDTWRDSLCANNIGLKMFGVTGGGGYPYPNNSIEFSYKKPLQIFADLYEAVTYFIQ